MIPCFSSIFSNITIVDDDSVKIHRNPSSCKINGPTGRICRPTGRQERQNHRRTDHNEIFLEEPEDNLFPPTQTALSSWLLDKTLGNDRNCLFIATHSPYIMTSFTESQSGEDFRLFFTIEHDRKSSIRTATESELQEIYDNGIDVFFNIEAFKDRI